MERYPRGKFGDALGAVRAEMKNLAPGLRPERPNHEVFRLYELCRPAVPPDECGWGAEGVLDIATIPALTPR